MTTPALRECPFCSVMPEFCEIRGLTDQPMKLWHPKAVCPLSETIVCSKPTREKCIEYWNLRTSDTPEIDREKIHKLINEVIADKIGYLKDEMGIFQDIEDAIIKALPELGG